jgi:hypothetical protein
MFMINYVPGKPDRLSTIFVLSAFAHQSASDDKKDAITEAI